MRSFPLQSEPVKTRERNQIIDLTERIRAIVREKGVRDGMVVIFNPHTTAGVTINENYDPDVKHDLLRKLSSLIPKNESYYQHDEGNSDSHLKTAIIGNSTTVLVEQGALILGRWQGIYLCEFDGPRDREVLVKLVSFMV